MNSSLRVLANFIDLINLHLQMTVGAHIVRLFSVLHKQYHEPMAILIKPGTPNFVKNRLSGKTLFSV